MKKILFFTNSFPYPPGEQFIETEIRYWSGLPKVEVILVPSKIDGKPRVIPDDINIINGTVRPNKFINAFRALFSSLLWKELCWLSENGKLNRKSAFIVLKGTAVTLSWKYRIKKILKTTGGADIAYCYWNSNAAYGACLVKAEGEISAVITRAHRCDLYEYQQPENYMPLKRQLRDLFDKVYSISEDGVDYLKSVYGFSDEKVNIARLGVKIPSKYGTPSSDGVIRVCSASFCVPVKRIEIIIQSIRIFGVNYPEKKIQWTHFGGGPLEQSLKKYAFETLRGIDNVSYSFVGMVDNLTILQHYESKPVDVFINTSESEGVPVSIMEAMSYGIPTIAPAVGGVSEIVNNNNGAILDIYCHSNDIVDSIIRLTGDNRDELRCAARAKIKKDYSASKNYKKFVSDFIPK